MRRLYVQFIAPVAVVGLCWLAGLAAGATLVGAVVGLVTGGLVASAVAVAASRRVGTIARMLVPDAVEERQRAGGVDDFDEVNEARKAVAQFVAARLRQREADSSLLAQQAAVLDRMTDGLMRVARDGTVTWANVAAGTLFSGRDPVGRSFIGATRDYELNQALRACFETGEDQQHTLDIPGDGHLVNAVITWIDADPPEALVTLRDITEVSRLQNLRRDFVANVSHELRTPLATIKILTETLIDVRESDEEAKRFLEKIDAEVDSMTALVRDLLDLTRVESASGRLALRAVESRALVQDVQERMRPLAARHRIRLSTHVDGEPVTLAADERRLHQALINLATNAIAHTPEGGTVSIATQARGDIVDFRVEDTGSGIPPNDLPRVWERFFKTDRARTGPGTGLGLAIVKHIALAHGGSVSVTSTPGEGSTFVVSIPRGNPEATQPPRPTADPDLRYVPG